MPNSAASFSQLHKQFLQRLADLWPLAKGSLAEIRKPCIRPNCPRCRSGQKHAAFILSFAHQGRRHCMYVPRDLVPLLRQALKNGRQLEAQLAQLGPAILRAYRQQKHPP